MYNFRDGLELTDDRSRIDVAVVISLLDGTYWADGRDETDMAKAIERSHPFGVFDETGRQIAFARIVTDGVYFGWLADVVVDRKYRGRGIGKWLVRVICDRPEYKKLSLTLRTRDAHALYERHGFLLSEMMVRPPA